MDNMEYFIELYGSLPRAGPGDDASTRRAFALIDGLPPRPRILDLGCGPGVQTLDLLRLCDGDVVALDLLPRMIERVTRAVEEAGFASRVEIVQADMNAMSFEPESFDLIWSEGAIYLMGFEEGLKKIRPLVRPGGHVAVSEAVWLRPDPPEEVVAFWREYPEIDTVEAKLRVIADQGYTSVGHFELPDSAWTRQYYEPLAQRVAELEAQWKGIADAEAVLATARRELDVFARHSSYYGYVFFVARREA
jgi:SAM-dependent methyltransferase